MLLKAHRPDVLILDLNMPGTDGITLMQQLRADGFDLPVLILTLSEAEDDLARALRAGANGYLLKSMEPDEVVDAILRAQRGETVVAPAMTAKLVKLYDQKGQDAELPARRADPARTRNPLPPVARRKQQGHRPHPRHQPRHRQAARAAYSGQAESVVARGSGGVRGGASGGAGRARRGAVGLPPLTKRDAVSARHWINGLA